MVIAGVSALIFFNVWRIAAVKLGKQAGPLGSLGRGMGALVTFSGA